MAATPLLTPSHRQVFAVSAVGVAMVCVPLWQVLQVQGDDLARVQADRALLDPVRASVGVQLGLLSHGVLAARTLAGDGAADAGRRDAADAVGAGLAALRAVLAAGAWHDAATEARQLDGDWRGLAQGVALRALTASQSDASHALRVEQALQVIDLVAVSRDGSTAGDDAVVAAAAPAAAAALRPWADAARWAAAPSPARRDAGGATGTPAQRTRALLALVQARAAALDGQRAALRRAQRTLQGALVALAALAACLLAAASRATAAARPPAPGADTGAPPSASLEASRQLLQRLRGERRHGAAGPAPGAGAPPRTAREREPGSTLPGD